MPAITSTGTYVSEQDVSQFIRVTSPFNPAIVLYGTWGPYDTRTTVTSRQELYNAVGEPTSASHLGLIIAKKYFEFGNILQVVRADSASDVVASVTLNDTASTPAATLKVEALYKGSFGNKITLTLDSYNSALRLRVYVKGILKETYVGLAKGSGTDKNAEIKAAINGISKWIKIATDATADANATAPAVFTGTALASGADSLPASAKFVGTATGGPGSTPSGLQIFSNDAIAIDALCAPDAAALGTDSDIKDVMIEIQTIAESRRDFIGLVDIPAAKSRADAITFADTTAAYSSTYISCFWPWVKTTESLVSASPYVPASGFALIALAKNDAAQYPWYSPMGYTRGTLSVFTDVEYNPSRGDRDLLEGSQINPIVFEPGIGVVLLGNWTKYATSQTTQFLHIRRLLISIKKLLAAAAKSIIGEPKDDITWEAFKSMSEKFLDNVVSKRGLTSYTISRDSDNEDPRELRVELKLQPIDSTAVITLNFLISRDAATFDS